jgi:ABC-type multidrug transport system fused ATPase/permease subunit
MKILTQEYKEQWNTSSKVLFRLLFTYFVLYILLAFLSPLFETPYRWIGKMVFGINYEYEVSGNGSGDHTFAYITLFVNAVSTFVIFIFWTLIDAKRKSYNKLLYWFLVFLRVVIVAAMLLYGFVKIFKLQFPSASLTHLLDPLGDLSPMGLAWTYMGFSKGFNVFVGFLEVLGGLLLIPRRTQTLGSFIVIGVMTQVAVMNFCFDIPVKLFSVHLVLMALVIFITDNRFLNVFIRNKAVEKYNYYHPVKNTKYHDFLD